MDESLEGQSEGLELQTSVKASIDRLSTAMSLR